MAKLKSVHQCRQCGFSSPQWLGRCPDCQSWNTLIEEVVDVAPASSRATGSLTEFSSEVVRLNDIKDQRYLRIPTRINELDRLLGGGLVEGQVVLLAGAPGIGKSTLMIQTAANLAQAPDGKDPAKVLYVSGEESLGQVSGRAQRLGIRSDQLFLVSETNLAKVLETVKRVSPTVLILDSVQTVYHPELAGSPGSVGQVRECSAELLRASKSKGIVTFLLGHVTKDGDLAGPKVLEHIVDTVLYFDTEKHHLLRILRVQKNRFGPSSEVGIFEMGERGLTEVPDASAFFLSEPGAAALPGRAVGVALEGSRPILVEVQALVAPTRYPLPRRMATGLDLNRTLVLIAALEKHLKLHLENQDVFISLAGGIRQKDPALDLAVCMAVTSSLRESPLPGDCVFLGEVGLLGQIARIAFLPQRLKEAEKMGFKRAMVPSRSLRDIGKHSMSLTGLENVADCARKMSLNRNFATSSSAVGGGVNEG